MATSNNGPLHVEYNIRSFMGHLYPGIEYTKTTIQWEQDSKLSTSASFTTVSVEAQTIYIVPFTLPHTPLPLHSPPLHLRLSDTDLHCKPQVSRAGHLKLLYRKVVFKVNIFNLSFSQFRDILRVHLKHYVVKATGLTFALHIGGWEDP